MRPSLLVIDMQNAFCCEEGSLNKIGLNIGPLRAPIKPIQDLINVARATSTPVIYTRYVYRPDYSDGGILIRELFPQIREQGGLRAGTWDIEIIDELRPAAHDLVVDKNRYSAFYDTALDAILRRREIDTLIFTGVTTNMCVESTARDAHFRDYRVWVVREATAEIDPQRHEASLTAIAYGFGRVVNLVDAAEKMRESRRPFRSNSSSV